MGLEQGAVCHLHPVKQEERDFYRETLLHMDLSLYVTIFLDPLDQGSAGSTPARYPLPGKGLVLHTARPVKKDRPSLAAFLGQSMIGGTLRSATRYIRTRSPQEVR